MSSPEEPHRPVPPQPGHDPAVGHPPPPAPEQQTPAPPGQPPVQYYAAPPAGTPPYRPPANGVSPDEQPYGAPPYGPPASGTPPYGPPYGPPANSAAPPGYAPPGYAPPGYAPPYGPPYYGSPAQPPPKKSRKALWIVLGIVGVVLLLAAAGVVILLNVVGGTTNQARGLADDFNKLIIAGDVDTAYDKYLDPALMQKLSREEFAAGVHGLGLDDSCKANYTSLKVSSSNGTNSADVAGSIDCDTKSV